MPTYQDLLLKHKCSTHFISLVSYLFTFKFSLLAVSHLFSARKFSGDYSAHNWKQFSYFSLSFLFISFPVMMAACAYFLYTEGPFSYAGYVSLEVIFLSAILAVLTLLDALAAIKCKHVGKTKTGRKVKVATGADVESDLDE